MGVLFLMVGLSAQTPTVDAVYHVTFNCENEETNDTSDDVLTASIRVDFSNPPSTGMLVLEGDFDLSVDVNSFSNTCGPPAQGLSHTFCNVPITMPTSFSGTTAFFTADPVGSLFTRDPVLADVADCGRCQSDAGVSGYPFSTPTSGPCSDKFAYAPDPVYFERTPIKYVRVILHFFQIEDPNNPGQPHPMGAMNFTEADIAVIRSWFDFTTPGNVNDLLGNLCPDNSVPSPYIQDSRIRILNRGIVGEDVFFHTDTDAWGEGFESDCDDPFVASNNGSSFDMLTDYVNVPGAESAFHVLVTGGAWVDNPDATAVGNIVGYPDDTDCYPGSPCGGFTNLGLSANGADGDRPFALIHGPYKGYIGALNNDLSAPCWDPNDWPFPGAAALGKGFLGELWHVFGVDHNGGNFHWNNGFPFGDECADTPDYSDENWMDCPPAGKCNLTQCQLGIMHRRMALDMPALLRYPDGNGGFLTSPPEPGVVNCDIVEPDIVIASGQVVTWGAHQKLRSNVIVEEKAILYINCDLGMPKDGLITVKPGGKLFVNGARIYSNCGEPWLGIEVEGDPTENQFSIQGQFYPQGYALLSSGTVIEGALHGVKNHQTENPNKGGGIIKAIKTTFLNNGTGVSFSNYQNINPYTGKKVGDHSYFQECNFMVDDDFWGIFESDFQAHAQLRGVFGIDFIACSFINKVSNGLTPSGLRGHGINAFNSDFSVEGNCNVPLQPGQDCPVYAQNRSEFRNLLYGISASKSGREKTYRVSNADFNDNCYGIYSLAVSNFYVVESNFKVGYGHTANNPYQGINITKGTGFQVEGNDFEPSTLALSGHTTVGIRVGSAGGVYNEIYRNTFNEIDFANVANGGNRGDAPNIGLQYRCNTMDDDLFDLTIIGPSYLGGLGIARNQGSTDEAAGNSFTGSPTEAFGHIWNEEQQVDYFHNGNPPMNITLSSVAPLFTTNSNMCLPMLPIRKEGDLTGSEQTIKEDEVVNDPDSTKRVRAADVLIRQHMIDTSGIRMDSVRQLLTGKGDLYSHFRIVDTYLQDGNPEVAKDYLLSLPDQVPMTAKEKAEHLKFTELKELEITAMQEGMGLQLMVEANLEKLSKLADEPSETVAVGARALINAFVGMTYGPEVELPAGALNRSADVSPPKQEGPGRAVALNILPNPARDRVTFGFSVPDGTAKVTVVISDLNGRRAGAVSGRGPAGSFDFDVSALEGGVYSASLTGDGERLLLERFVVIE